MVSPGDLRDAELANRRVQSLVAAALCFGMTAHTSAPATQDEETRVQAQSFELHVSGQELRSLGVSFPAQGDADGSRPNPFKPDVHRLGRAGCI